MAGNVKCFELSITPMAEKLFDENTQVRLQVTLEVGNWMLSYRDRYSFWHRMIPLLLTRFVKKKIIISSYVYNLLRK